MLKLVDYRSMGYILLVDHIRSQDRTCQLNSEWNDLRFEIWARIEVIAARKFM